jgi:hypothetical protein
MEVLGVSSSSFVLMMQDAIENPITATRTIIPKCLSVFFIQYSFAVLNRLRSFPAVSLIRASGKQQNNVR